MDIDIAATKLAGDGASVKLIGVPDVCPRCHRSIHPKLFSCAILDTRGFCQAVYRCTHQKCQELFIANYSSLGRSSGGRAEYSLGDLAPIAARPADFPPTIPATSPTFVEIYNQSIEAEGAGLDQLVGIGLRKALEFLIKDYCVIEAPDQEDAIRSSTLASCISKFVTDTNVKECAKRAVWLGNDETHYVRKWESKDIRDLKVLVKLTVNWIDNALLTKRYVAEMTAGNSPNGS